MDALLVLILALAVVAGALVVLGAGIRSWSSRSRRTAEELAGPAPTLDYVVPPGQDPAVVLNALATEGYAVRAAPARTRLLHVSCPAGPDRDRAHVRATIASVHHTAIDAGAPMEPGEVRFTDET